MPKCGIRGTATARLAFHDMPVPVENILGPVGKGLRVALTVLDLAARRLGPVQNRRRQGVRRRRRCARQKTRSNSRSRCRIRASKKKIA